MSSVEDVPPGVPHPRTARSTHDLRSGSRARRTRPARALRVPSPGVPIHAPPQPSAALHVEDDGVRIRLSGDVDLAFAPHLRGVIDAALDLRSSCCIDLGGLSFIDSSGVRELLRAHRAAAARRVLLVIEPSGSPAVMRPFELLGLLDVLPFVDPVVRREGAGRRRTGAGRLGSGTFVAPRRPVAGAPERPWGPAA